MKMLLQVPGQLFGLDACFCLFSSGVPWDAAAGVVGFVLIA